MSSPMSAIYALSLDGTTHRYVGLTSRGVERRFREHLANAVAGVDFPVYRWIRKHGPAAVQIVVLEECLPEELAEAEARWIAALRLDGANLLNCSDGGEGLSNPAPHIVAARVAANRVRFLDPAERARMGAIMTSARAGRVPWRTGVPLDDETKAKIAATLKGRKPPAAAAEAARVAHLGNQYRKGIPHTDEVKARISSTLRSREVPPEERAAKSAGSLRALHNRWHVKRGVVKPDCALCA